VAAFIAEPVTGAAGGALVPPGDYFQRVRDICSRHDVLLIADEVITGFGRLGRPFGIERFGVVPDILTFGKGVSAGYAPLAGLIAAGRIAHAFDTSKARFEHSFTMAGHPVACAAGLATVRRLVGDHLIERVAALEKPFFAVLHEMLDDVQIVGDIRGMGLLAGVDLVRDRSTREPFQPSANMAYRAAAAAMHEGVLVYACRGGAGDGLTAGDTLLLLPPFISTENDLREMAIRLARGLQSLSSLS
jgi:adenosylmethionine-8-amino-7-oxononanoate aminotransferase